MLLPSQQHIPRGHQPSLQVPLLSRSEEDTPMFSVLMASSVSLQQKRGRKCSSKSCLMMKYLIIDQQNRFKSCFLKVLTVLNHLSVTPQEMQQQSLCLLPTRRLCLLGFFLIMVGSQLPPPPPGFALSTWCASQRSAVILCTPNPTSKAPSKTETCLSLAASLHFAACFDCQSSQLGQ